MSNLASKLRIILQNSSSGLSLASPLTGLGSATGAVTAADTILSGMAKINDRLALSGGTLTGQLLVPGGNAASPGLRITGTNMGVGGYGAYGFLKDATTNVVAWYSGAFILRNGCVLRFGNSTNAYGASAYVDLLSTAAGILEQRNGTSAQEFQLYGTYTDASNYRRLRLYDDGSYFQITSNYAGTGGTRGLKIRSQSGTLVLNDGNRDITITSGGTAGLRTIDAGADATYDLGKSGTQWRDLYLSRNAYLPGLPTSDPAVAGQLWNNSGVLTVSAG